MPVMYIKAITQDKQVQQLWIDLLGKVLNWTILNFAISLFRSSRMNFGKKISSLLCRAIHYSHSAEIIILLIFSLGRYSWLG